MSDNGIYILKTKDDEFRVAYCTAIDNLTFNEAWNCDVQSIEASVLPNNEWNEIAAKTLFGKCKVWNNSNAAMCEAYKIEKEKHLYGVEIQYGIVTLDFSHKQFPNP